MSETKSIRVGETTYPVVFEKGKEPGSGFFEIDGRKHTFTARLANPHRIVIEMDGRRQEVWCATGKDGLIVWAGGTSRTVEIVDERAARGKKGGKKRGPKEVTPSTPATVVSILVSDGETVCEGQGVVVVSAMKMESTLAAPYAGVVKLINTKVGTNVNPGEILVTIEPKTPDED